MTIQSEQLVECLPEARAVAATRLCIILHDFHGPYATSSRLSFRWDYRRPQLRNSRFMLIFTCVFLACNLLNFVVSPFSPAQDNALGQSPWQIQQSGTSASLRGLCVVNDTVVWTSGAEGTVIRTEDAGKNWLKVSVDGADKLDFRDIHAFDAQRAVVISAGQPARVYRTEDGGKSWTKRFEHPNEKSFFDAVSFWDDKHGIAMSDPIDDRVLLIETLDGGKTWKELTSERRPVAQRGEGGFAASGTNMRVIGRQTVLIALGSAEKDQQVKSSRIVFSGDRSKTWSATQVPMPRNPSSGIFSMAFADQKHGIVVGGDYLKQEVAEGNIALTGDGGKTWSKPPGTPPRGYRSGVAYAEQSGKQILVAVGPSGTDISSDGGQNWRAVSDQGFHAVQFAPDRKSGWASGAEGRIAYWIGVEK